MTLKVVKTTKHIIKDRRLLCKFNSTKTNIKQMNSIKQISVDITSAVFRWLESTMHHSFTVSLECCIQLCMQQCALPHFCDFNLTRGTSRWIMRHSFFVISSFANVSACRCWNERQEKFYSITCIRCKILCSTSVKFIMCVRNGNIDWRIRTTGWMHMKTHRFFFHFPICLIIFAPLSIANFLMEVSQMHTRSSQWKRTNFKKHIERFPVIFMHLNQSTNTLEQSTIKVVRGRRTFYEKLSTLRRIEVEIIHRW